LNGTSENERPTADRRRENAGQRPSTWQCRDLAKLELGDRATLTLIAIVTNPLSAVLAPTPMMTGTVDSSMSVKPCERFLFTQQHQKYS
jgi:hypothetical protein